MSHRNQDHPRCRRRPLRLQHHVAGQPNETAAWWSSRDDPRVSGQGALASKATVFPIAKIATTSRSSTPRRDPQRHTGQTPASFEPALDYVVVKIPLFSFEKFPRRPTSPRT